MDTSCELRSEQAVAEAVKKCSDVHDDAVGQIVATVQSLESLPRRAVNARGAAA
jgi:glycine cleavage system H lipoate-binding protein